MRGDDPAEEYTDPGSLPSLGSADAMTEWSFLTEEDQREFRKELRRKEQRRIKPGFQLPKKD